MLKNRRNFLKSTIVTAAATSSTSCTKLSNEESDSRPNIILFLTDDQRYDTLGCTGHPIVKSPNIDQLAEKGCNFQNAFVTTPICAASRASIFTGQLERTHKYTFKTKPLEARFVEQSYPYILKKNGYTTALVGKLGVRSQNDSLRKAFDFFAPVSRSPYYKIDSEGKSVHETDLVSKMAKEFISASNTDNKPFMLSVSFNAPHAAKSSKVDNPFPPPPISSKMYESIDIPSPRVKGDDFLPKLPAFMKSSLNRKRFFWRWSDDASYQKNMRNYFRMISGIDSAVGDVIRHIKSLNISDNTIVIFSSDNGFFLAEKGFAGKWSHYEQSIRVPLIIYDPRNKSNEKNSSPHEFALNVDICPTILDFAEIKDWDKSYGQSLRPLLSKPMHNLPRDEFLIEHLMKNSDNPRWEGLRSNMFSYARYLDQTPVYEFLHDLNSDIDQTLNLALDERYKKTLERMRNRCDELIREASQKYT